MSCLPCFKTTQTSYKIHCEVWCSFFSLFSSRGRAQENLPEELSRHEFQSLTPSSHTDVLTLFRWLLRTQLLPSMPVLTGRREKTILYPGEEVGSANLRHFGRKGRKETTRLAAYMFGIWKHLEEGKVGLTLHLKTRQPCGLDTLKASTLGG